MDVRRALDDELPAVDALTVAAYGQYRAEMNENLWQAYEAELSASAAHAERGEAFVAVDGDDILGSVWLFPSTSDPERMSFRYLAVSPQARGRGIGRLLIEACTASARERGMRELHWRTASFMRPARRLYASMGFEPAPEPLDLIPGVELWEYRLPLR